MSEEIPRRCYLDKLFPEERAIYDAIQDVEQLGAHPQLTAVVMALDDAQTKLADWFDYHKPPEPKTSSIVQKKLMQVSRGK